MYHLFQPWGCRLCVAGDAKPDRGMQMGRITIDIKETIAFECRGGGCKFAPSMRPSNDDSDCVGQATNHINGGT